MDPNLGLYRSILHLSPWERREQMGHLPRSELNRVTAIVEREEDAQKLEKSIAGRDLIQVALNDPSEIIKDEQLKYTLLGRTIYPDDEISMIRRITNNAAGSSWNLISYIAGIDRDAKPFCLDAWKLVYCDVYYVDGDSATLQEIYEARLREEEIQTPTERARELRKKHGQIQKIVDAREKWGFIYYLSREVNQKYGPNWKTFWNRVNNACKPMMVTHSSIHCQGRDNWMELSRLATEHWPIFSPNENLGEDDDLRKRFKEYTMENRSKTAEDKKKKKKKRKRKNTEENDDLLSPGILRNTFIVIPNELISSNRNYWDASEEEETVYNGEKYQGRVKVAKWSLGSWFYAARWEGVSLRDMWLKAQRYPDKYWIYYTKRLEEWDHEPYV
ncbi:hypothetical protein FBEOM_12873 [Fusarium beomiforme]|uniref:Uncharacterized protein n=1 Tax=Fusarium beomiforme TaxID=44412 RepID=A0A9P5A7U6_9HYPO|nr:hypothetical protein FBEOM_12873 [Fusarium beomiforme]